MSDGVTSATRDGMTLNHHLHSFAPLQVQIYIYIFKMLPWRKRSLGFGVASKLSDVSSAGAESRWGDDLVGVHHASCQGQRFEQESILEVFLGACTRSCFPSSNTMNLDEEVLKPLFPIKRIQMSSRQEVRFVHKGQSS